ncbi:hypothetical protein PMAYCL1PPCAC_05824, partial [Pristionchus mayeri]
DCSEMSTVYDDFNHARALDACEVAIDGRTFPVSATILASVSNYFDQAFHEPAFRESQTKRVVIDRADEMEISKDDFHAYLRHSYNAREKITGDTYLGLLKCADYFSSKTILEDVEQFIIEHCCPEKWRSSKMNPDQPFAIEMIAGIELVFTYQLAALKEHMKEMLSTMRFHTFLKKYSQDVMVLPDELRIWIFDHYATTIIASQKA